MGFLWGGCGLSQVVRGAGRGRQRVCGGSQARLRTARRPTAQPLAGNLVQSLPRAESKPFNQKLERTIPRFNDVAHRPDKCPHLRRYLTSKNQFDQRKMEAGSPFPKTNILP